MRTRFSGLAVTFLIASCTAGSATDAGLGSDAHLVADAGRVELGVPLDSAIAMDASLDGPHFADAMPIDADESVDAPFFVIDARPPTCASARDCAPDEWCSTPPGHCDAPGTCVPVMLPTTCPAGGAAVCGCDDQTYANACAAAQQPVSIAELGDCRTDTICSSNADCTASEYCEPASTCGGPGECKSRHIGDCESTACTLDCGCDGVVYVNACARERAGVARDSGGTCAGAAIPCTPGRPAGCCVRATECAAGDQCVPVTGHGDGRCEPGHVAGTCWSDLDCGTRGLVCIGPQVCPCGDHCSGPDAPGRCEWPDLGVPGS